MELDMDQFAQAEQLFGRCLMLVPNVKLWTVYLNYIRRRNDLTNDTSGTARQTITRSYEFVIDNIGVDRDSGPIWQDYIQFIKNGPGQIGGTGWQDQQKMDQLRKAYHRAINVPMSAVNNLWKEYDQFEMGLNKMTVRQHPFSYPGHPTDNAGSKIHSGEIPWLHVCQKCQHCP
jgi:cleavage stimulation factor subunit 3